MSLAAAGRDEVRRVAPTDAESREGNREKSKQRIRPGRIIGRVVLPGGIPVPRASVLAVHVLPDFVDTVDGPTIQGKLLEERREVDTGDAGTFQLDDFPTGRVLLGVRHPELAPLDLDFFHQRGETPHDLGDLFVSHGVVLSGRVVNPAGAGVSGAEVFLSSAHKKGPLGDFGRLTKASVPLARTDADGFFESKPLAVGRWSLVVSAPGYPNLEKQGETWSPGPSSGHVFVLVEPTKLSGTVVADEGYVLEDLNVEAVADASEIRKKLRTTCDKNGHFVFLDVPAELEEPLAMSVRNKHGWPETLDAAVTAFPNDVDVTLKLKPSSWLSFGIVDRDTGQPLTEPKIALHHWADQKTTQRTDLTDALVMADGLGRYRLRLSPDRLALAVAISSSSGHYSTYYKKGLEPVPGETIDLGSLSLQRRRSLRVNVSDASGGEPLRDVRVYAVREDTTGQKLDEVMRLVRDGQTTFEYTPDRMISTTGQMGECAIPYDASHAWLLVATHPEYVPGRPTKIPADYGGDPVELKLQRGATVRVTIKRGGRPAKKTSVHLNYEYPDERNAIINPSGFGSGQRWEHTDEAGQCLFHNVLPGTHRFLVDFISVDTPLHLSTEEGIHEFTIELP